MIEILDTTLRDGAQSYNIAFSIMDKIDIIKALDSLGIQFVEAGTPSFNKKDNELFKNLKDSYIGKIVAFGKTRKKDCAVINDDNFIEFAETETDVLCIYGKSSLYHVKHVLQTSGEENLKMIEESVKYLVQKNKTVIFDAEHFFDGYKYDKKFTIDCISRAYYAGAKRLVLCDTNGGSLPYEISLITKEIVSLFKDAIIGIHCHNDNGLSVANTLEAVKSGARHVQGTILGLGERCGNANLSNLIPLLKFHYDNDVLSDDNLKKLTSVSKKIAEICNISFPENTPYIGSNAFTHKAGTHIDGILKDYSSFEHIDPALVGNKRKLLISDNSGRTAVMEKIKRICPNIDKDDDKITKILQILKEKENIGYTYEGAENSFLLLANEILNKPKDFFIVKDYQIATSFISTLIKASMTICVNGITKTAEAEGNGPVNALDLAMRECLTSFYSKVHHISLIDYKVRVINPKGATAAVVRVLITTSDGKNVIKTIGVSEDIIKASFEALSDSYKILLAE